ncbi:DnaB-like helicase C-terminal domain-containing protein [Leisingera sp. M523]|uniref:DnaB-like helicase C-terminal domain-containing protein n=1 Tax=Leisingera sp. M523 TaxID=2867013 RepID=UPI0021A63AF5|nr:DnaB-like helicase C-terminal domain-containing protein [Leisingera sp. M523]UWQ30234.1 AAA family ATPase [Leisingera sp. M523]
MRHEQNFTADLFSTEAEQQVLGAILANNDRYHDVSSFLRSDQFWDPVHGDIWKNLAVRIERDHVACPITVATDLAAHDGLTALGGKKYLQKLLGASVAGSQVSGYARMVQDLYQRRVICTRLEAATSAVKGGHSVDEAAADLELMLHEREEASAEPRTMSFLKAQTRALEQMHQIKAGHQVSVPTGIKALDDAVSLAPKRYTILGGGTSMGKTALSLSIATAAARAGFGVGFVTLEMPEEDLANRINSTISQVPYKAYDRPMSENSWSKVVGAAKELQSLPMEIFSDRVRDVSAVLSEGKKLKRKMQPNGNFKGFKLLVLDYIQLMRGRGESAHVRLAQVANDLKQVAKVLDVHVLALAQIDRAIGRVSDYNEARPRLADLRGSGDLENAPDNVMFVFRPEYYLTRQTPPKKDDDRADWEADIERWKGKAEIIVGKARMGEIGTVTVGCDMGYNRFFDLEDQPEEMPF